MSQEEFGARGGVKKLAQLRYEKGERSPDIDYLQALAPLGVDIGYILHGHREPHFSSHLLGLERVARALHDRLDIDDGAFLEVVEICSASARHRLDFGMPLVEEPAIVQLLDSLFENGALLSKVFVAVNTVMRERDTPLPLAKFTSVALLVYRSAKEASNVDIGFVEEAVSLAMS